MHIPPKLSYATTVEYLDTLRVNVANVCVIKVQGTNDHHGTMEGVKMEPQDGTLAIHVTTMETEMDLSAEMVVVLLQTVKIRTIAKPVNLLPCVVIPLLTAHQARPPAQTNQLSAIFAV